MTGTSQYVTLGVADELFAAPVERVWEILELRPIARLPRAPASLLGMIDVRGQGVPVLDLRSTLGMAPSPDDENTRILVLMVKSGGQDVMLGLKTDRVYEVTVLDAEALQPAPDATFGCCDHAIAGIGRRNGAFVTVLDLDRMFASPELDAIGAASAA